MHHMLYLLACADIPAETTSAETTEAGGWREIECTFVDAGIFDVDAPPTPAPVVVWVGVGDNWFLLPSEIAGEIRITEGAMLVEAGASFTECRAFVGG